MLPDQLELPALRELGRVVKSGGIIRLLEYVRPKRRLRRFITRLWQPWSTWAYGASFDRQAERHVRPPVWSWSEAVLSSTIC